MIRTIILAGVVFASFVFGSLSDSTLSMRKRLHEQGARQLCRSSARSDDVSSIQNAFGLFYLGLEKEKANETLQKAIEEIGGYNGFSELSDDQLEKYDKWMPLLLRSYYLFAKRAEHLDDKSAKLLNDIFKSYVNHYGKELEPLSKDVWLIKDNSMKDITRICSLYLILQTLKDTENNDYPQKLSMWEEYLLKYCLERSMNGLNWAVCSGNDGASVLASFLNLYDLTDNTHLQKRIMLMLDIMFADWSQDQFELVRCGTRSCANLHEPGKDSLQKIAEPFVCSDMGWSQGSKYKDEGSEYIYIAATTEWRMPNVVMDILLDNGGQNDYEYRSQRPAILEKTDNGLKRLLPDQGLVRRYSYCTNEYVLGGLFIDPSIDVYSDTNKKGYADWILHESTSGLMFNGGSFILITNEAEKHMKPVQCIGFENIMIFQQLQTNENQVNLKVHISENLRSTMIERGGWLIFKEGSTWAAIKGLSCHRIGADCGYYWIDNNHLELKEAESPLVMITSSASKYRNIEKFVEYITEHDWRIRDNMLVYKATDANNRPAVFTMNITGATPPSYNEKELAFSSMMQFDSPMISSAKNSGIVTVKKDRRKQVYYLQEDKVVEAN